MSDQPQYTTAIIAAVPTAEDPVHEIVAEDAHVTLQFLGEAADLSDEQIEGIKTTLGLIAANVYAFPVDVSGTAELGQDKAQVLLIQSTMLTKIRETLGLDESVSTAVASVEQFPNWIPHLTMQYEGEQPDVAAFKEVTIGSLELWLADEHLVFPLGESAPVTAAGYKTFTEHLHPRGADGRFIEKFGVVKYLTAKGWAYGKVEGIYEENDQVKLTVTPSDLAGKTHGESLVLSPKQVYRAPKTKAHLKTSDVGVTKIGGQGGSNPGGMYQMPSITPQSLDDAAANGVATEKFYVKKPKTKSHGANEALANALYEEAGVPVPEVDFHADGQLYSKVIDGEQNMAAKLKDPEWTDQVRRNFAVDAWLGNRDVFGMTYDNILTDANGVPWRIDNGGALLYRAMGEKKTDFGSKVSELDAFRQGKKAAIYGPGMTKAQEIDGAERVVAITPQRIEEMVSDAGLPASLADTLKARRLYLANYYGLQLPESQKAAEAQEGSTAPVVDTADLAANKGKPRGWFKTTLAQAAMLLQGGDKIELPDGTTRVFGIDGTGNALSIVGEQASLLGWQQEFGPAAEVYFRKTAKEADAVRPDHGQKLKGSDLAAQRWHRGDKISALGMGAPLKIKGWNDSTGAVLVEHPDGSQQLLDTFGADGNTTWTVERWDPPAVDTLVEDIPATPVPTVSQLEDVVTKASEPEVEDDLVSYKATSDGAYEQAPAVAPGKTGQAAETEAALKADLVTPLPTGSGAPAPGKTTAPGGAKTMVVGDGTEASTGDAVTSKKDGKTYTFVKPKGQYAVVTDPNGDDPTKQLLKLASTMTQPGKLPAGDLDVELPKTATGEVPALGMMAQAKDGWAGEITLISPDGKFVFITDANGKRKRKSTGTVSITGGVVPAAEQPQVAVGPVKDYGPEVLQPWKGEEKATGWLAVDDLTAAQMVHVSYADGTHGLEPYTGQPLGSLQVNSQEKVAVFGSLKDYLGPIAPSQLAAAGKADNGATTYQVIFMGNVFFTDGTTGPSGGLVLWYADDNDGDLPGTDAFEMPLGGKPLMTIIGSEKATSVPLVMPEIGSVAFQAADEVTYDGFVTPILYGDEAKTLSGWKGQLSPGQEISLDGQNWLSIKAVSPSGSVTITTGNGQDVFINPWSSATYVVKAPALVDGDAAPSQAVDTDDDLGPVLPKKKGTDLVAGDVIKDFEGNISVIKFIEPDESYGDGTSALSVHAYGGPVEGEYMPGSAELPFLGNAAEGFVSLKLADQVEHFYPGLKIEVSSTEQLTVASYPSLQLDTGGFKFAAMVNGDPDDLILVDTHEAFGPEAVLPMQFAPGSSASELGLDIAKLNELFNPAPTVETPPDHYWLMTEQGLTFGTAQYPIFFNAADSSYYRSGPNGVEGWIDGKWEADASLSVVGMDKVWDGAPFQGALVIPENTDLTLYGAGAANYKPKPGEAVAIVTLASGNASALVVSPSGSFAGDQHVMTIDGSGNLLTPGYTADSLLGGGSTLNVIHDPFASEAADSKPRVTHQDGPQPPAAIGQKLQSVGYTPKPGETLWAVQTEDGKTVVLVKQPDGNYLKLMTSGQLGSKVWTTEELLGWDAQPNLSHFTWTYLPEGADAPTAVPGLPEGYAPFVPGEGQSLLKVTLANGKTNVYVQKQTGAGWYELGPDGSVNESSDAVKSNHVVQQKLSTASSGSAAKYELLHPLPEGLKPAGESAAVPTLSNKSGGEWTPEPDQKVMALTSFDGDTDPWFFFQEADTGWWVPAPNTEGASGSGGFSNEQAQEFMAATTAGKSGSQYKLVYDGSAAAAAGPAPAFSGYTPKAGEEVFQEPNGSHWVVSGSTVYPVNDDGTLSEAGSMSKAAWDADPAISSGDVIAKVWPAAASAVDTPPSFGGYTPVTGDQVLQEPDGTYWVKSAADKKWHAVTVQGTLSQASLDDVEWGQSQVAGTTQAWPVPGGSVSDPATGGVFEGYQSAPTDNVLQAVGPAGSFHLVKLAGKGIWQKVLPGGQLEDAEDGFSQDSIEYATTSPNNPVTFTVLQGSVKAGAVTEPAEPLVAQPYAGVASLTLLTLLTPGTYNFGGYTPTPEQTKKIEQYASVLHVGQSIYALEDSTGGLPTTGVVLRKADGSWETIYANGDKVLIAGSDQGMEEYAQSAGWTIHKAQFTAPMAAPAAPKTYSGPTISGWADLGIPDPATFGYLASPGDELPSASVGDWVYMQGNDPSAGMFGKIAAVPGVNDNTVALSDYVMVKDGKTGAPKSPAVPVHMPITAMEGFYLSSSQGTGAAPNTNPGVTSTPAAPSTPAASAPSAPQAASPAAPVGPQYPGAQKPSQEDINAWGGALTKDGYIPSPGMFVSGKGPMTGKIVSVSKDKTKAVVLKADGTKTTRLIEAIKTDKSANYSAYAAPATLKDIPQGMPLAVDSVAEVLAKTPQDGKFRAILSAHPGVSHGQMTVTKATGPSGKVYSRVHMTLTPAQREQLMSLLAGVGEKGDWATSSKSSEQVAIGDQLPMRKSSTDNPDGTPRWKVDPSQVPPTHKVTGVADDPSGSGVKIVTMANIQTGEVITSRFHPGKPLTTYAWDPNKPKKVAPGAFSIGETAKAMGWALANDGGISAAKNGAGDAQLYNEPGSSVTKSAFQHSSTSWQTLRNVSEDGVVIELVDPKGSDNKSTTGTTVISVPEGLDEKALGAALSKLGVDYSPMTQDSAKDNVRGMLRTLLSLDMSDVDTAKGWSDDKLFTQAGKTMGITDLGWHDVLVGVDESTGTPAYFWSDRARNALAAKSKVNVIYRSANSADAAQIVSTVKYGSASSILKRTAGMLDGTGSTGSGASWSTDNGNHAGHGSYASAGVHSKLPSGNNQASYKHSGMMVYHRPEAVLGRIMDYRTGTGDVYGKGKGSGSDHLAYATSLSSVTDFFLGGGLPTEAVGFIAVSDQSERAKAIEKLKADGYSHINGRPVEEIVILKSQAQNMSPNDLPPVTLPSNARPILDLPTSYGAAPSAADATVVAAAEETAA